MYKEIGSFQAKTQLAELLQRVKKGNCFTITLHGKPIADLVPSESSAHIREKKVHEAIEAMCAINKVKGVSSKIVSEWIAEGRR